MTSVIQKPADTDDLAMYLTHVALDPIRLGAIDWEDAPNLTEHEWARVSSRMADIRDDLLARAGEHGRELWLKAID